MLDGKIIGFSEASNSSVSKGETLNDTIKTVNNYCDLIVMRHPIEGSARFASEIADVPIINAGDGANQHPTQTLLDLYSIRKTQGRLENLNIFLVGDLKYGRTVHSLVMAMSRWNATFNFISPNELKMPVEYKQYLDNLGLKYYEHTDLSDTISKADLIYMTRVHKERFSDPIEYEKVKNVYVLKNSMLKNTKENMRILHPLPRVNEINQDVDKNPKAYYFEQALNGVYARQAILCSLLGIK
jgi:aspartate carbamoyltransferase catalytic subunit